MKHLNLCCTTVSVHSAGAARHIYISGQYLQNALLLIRYCFDTQMREMERGKWSICRCKSPTNSMKKSVLQNPPNQLQWTSKKNRVVVLFRNILVNYLSVVGWQTYGEQYFIENSVPFWRQSCLYFLIQAFEILFLGFLSYAPTRKWKKFTKSHRYTVVWLLMKVITKNWSELIFQFRQMLKSHFVFHVYVYVFMWGVVLLQPKNDISSLLSLLFFWNFAFFIQIFLTICIQFLALLILPFHFLAPDACSVDYFIFGWTFPQISFIIRKKFVSKPHGTHFYSTKKVQWKKLRNWISLNTTKSMFHAVIFK